MTEYDARPRRLARPLRAALLSTGALLVALVLVAPVNAAASDAVPADPQPTAITGAAVPTRVAYGSTHRVTAAGLPLDATGTVEFREADTGTWLCAAPVSQGEATCDAPGDSLWFGHHGVSATYSGDAVYAPGQVEFGIDVLAASTIRAGATSGRYGQAHLLAVTGTTDDMSGTVAFRTGRRLVCEATLVPTAQPLAPTAAVVGCSAPATLLPGTYGVTAAYSGDGYHLDATATTTLTVAKLTPRLRTYVAAAVIRRGHADTLSVRGLPARATGTVAFSAPRGHRLCTARVARGGARCLTSRRLAAGTYRVGARYSGNAVYSAASARATFRVRR